MKKVIMLIAALFLLSGFIITESDEARIRREIKKSQQIIKELDEQLNQQQIEYGKAIWVQIWLSLNEKQQEALIAYFKSTQKK